MRGPSKEQLELRDALRVLVNTPGWVEVYTRGVDRMKVAQSAVMAETTSDQKRAVEAGIWREVRRMIEFPAEEIEHITHLEERASA